eukprot:3814109-Prymnesium_polylepis.1
MAARVWWWWWCGSGWAWSGTAASVVHMRVTPLYGSECGRGGHTHTRPIQGGTAACGRAPCGIAWAALVPY